jgi:hypothetical protein
MLLREEIQSKAKKVDLLSRSLNHRPPVCGINVGSEWVGTNDFSD